MSSLLCPICASPVTADARTRPTCGARATGTDHVYALRPGTYLDGGSFSVGRVLGHGGFGLTYLGADLRRGHPVALKEFFPADSGRQGLDVTPPATLRGQCYQAALARFLEARQVLARFAHLRRAGACHRELVPLRLQTDAAGERRLHGTRVLVVARRQSRIYDN